jgi:hypothetical protein
MDSGREDEAKRHGRSYEDIVARMTGRGLDSPNMNPVVHIVDDDASLRDALDSLVRSTLAALSVARRNLAGL